MNGNGQGTKKLSNAARRDDKPWYKQFWPWFIIALPLTAVIASFATLWIAVNNPDRSVLDRSQGSVLKSQLNAQPASGANLENQTGKSATSASN